MLRTPRAAVAAFAAETARARKILVVEIAGLGDLVHSLPAMWSIRATYPDAELHCLVRQEHAALLALAPWIDSVWPYRRGRGLDPRAALAVARRLRRERFDIAVDLMGSDHASAAVWLSGAGRRLVRRPGVRRVRLAWRWAATDLVAQPFDGAPMYLQRWHAVAQAGIVSEEVRFELRRARPGAADGVASGLPAAAGEGLPADAAGPLVHVSPFTRRTHKELPPEQLATLLSALHERVPEARFVLSCAGGPRERAALDALLAALPFAPWRVRRGDLSAADLFELIGGADLHLSGDTGSMHLAWLAGTPSVTWMSSLGNLRAWAPAGPRHAVVCGASPPQRFLDGVCTDELVAASVALLRNPPAGAQPALSPGGAGGARAPRPPPP